MDTFLPQILAFPTHPPPAVPLTYPEYDKQIKTLLQFLNQIPASKLASGVAGTDLLDILDPFINTLPYLYVLLAHINGSGGKQSSGAHSKALSINGPLWVKILDFIEVFDPIQVRYGGAEFRRLVEVVGRTAQLASKSSTAIAPIRSAILRLDPSSSCFTSSHLMVIRLCLETREYNAALPILEKDIYHFPLHSDKGAANSHSRYACSQQDSSSTFITTSSGLSEKLEYQDHLKYFLFGAMIYIGLKDWERALLFLDIVISSPTVNSTSMIQVEAYKKWVLVSLLLRGQPLPVPKTTNPQAIKHYSSLAKAYETLAKTFKLGLAEETTARRLIAESEAGQSIWQDDCNVGLVCQVIDAFRRFSILKLQKTYAALSIHHVAHRTSPEPTNFAETAAYVTGLITSDQLDAILVQSSGDAENWVLRFPTTYAAGPQARSEQQQYADLQRQKLRTSKLADHVRGADRRLALNKDYIDWVRKINKAKDAGGPGDAAILLGEDYAPDEDMMADL